MTKSGWKPALPPFRKYKKDMYTKHGLTSSFVYQLGEGDMIRRQSREVPPSEILTSDTQAKIKYLKKCLLKYRRLTGMGRGIAAVQVGIPERFAVIYLPEENRKLLVIINPQIINRAGESLKFPEGCMSEGPLFAPVVRPAWTEFSYLDEQGREQMWTEKDDTLPHRIANRVFQHEIDHMDGIIFLDRAILSELTLDSDPTFYEKASFEEVLPQKTSTKK